MSQPENPAPLAPPTAATPSASPPPSDTPSAVAAASVLTAAKPAPAKIRWLRLVLIAAPVAAAILIARHLYLNADSTREAEQIALARKQAAVYPTQPERAYGNWRHLLEEPDSSAGLKATARAEIQSLLDRSRLIDRFESLIAENLRRGENGVTISTAFARELQYLIANFDTPQTPAQAQDRIDRLQHIDALYRDAINDRIQRGQYDKALEKLTMLYQDYPEAEFVRPVIARIQSEVAEAMITLDDLEGARERLQAAIKIDPLALYRQRLDALERSIKSLDPTEFIQAGKLAEAEGRWEEARAQYQHALDFRRSNKEAAAGYTRMLKFYAEVFLKTAEENGELTEEGARFVKLAAENAKKMAQFGDPELVLARANLLLAEAHFQEDNYKDAKSMVDAALSSVGRPYRDTSDGAYLMARIFKLYYHLGRNLNRLPQARQCLALADQYCRLALEKGQPKAGDLFVKINALAGIELDLAGSLTGKATPTGADTPPTRDVGNLVNEGPLGQVGPLDVGTSDREAGRPAPLRDPTPAAANPGAAPPDGVRPEAQTPPPDPLQDKLLNPLQ